MLPGRGVHDGLGAALVAATPAAIGTGDQQEGGAWFAEDEGTPWRVLEARKSSTEDEGRRDGEAG